MGMFEKRLLAATVMLYFGKLSDLRWRPVFIIKDMQWRQTHVV